MVTLDAKSPHHGFSLRTLTDDTHVNVRTFCASPNDPAHATVLDTFAGSNTNYDRLAEYAVDVEGLDHTTGFTHGY